MEAQGTEKVESLCNGLERVNGFCYLGDKLNSSGDLEAAVTAIMTVS